jgi:hypothetical protein
VDPA